MNLVQILLPLYGADGKNFGEPLYAQVAHELTERFGGMTAYARSPASGLWKEWPGRTLRDDIVVYEVMVQDLDRAWWSGYRGTLEKRFAQRELVVRSLPAERL